MTPLRTLAALLLLAALPGVLLDGVWLRGETPYPVGALETTLPWKRIEKPDEARVQNPSMSDAVLQFIPWDITLRREWRGVFPPAWNPYEGIGAPLAANPQARTLDPIRLVQQHITDIGEAGVVLAPQVGCELEGAARFGGPYRIVVQREPPTQNVHRRR